MSVSSIALSSLATSPPAPLPTAVQGPHREVTADNTTVAQSQAVAPAQPDDQPSMKAALPPKVGQVIDISA